MMRGIVLPKPTTRLFTVAIIKHLRNFEIRRTVLPTDSGSRSRAEHRRERSNVVSRYVEFRVYGLSMLDVRSASRRNGTWK